LAHTRSLRASLLSAISAIALAGCATTTQSPAQLDTSPKSDEPVVTNAPEARVIIDVTMTEGTNMAAALSPDGKTIILALQGVLWSIPAEGGDATALTSPALDAQEPVWSPDGSEIAFYAFPDNTFSIWTVKPDGSDLTQLSDIASDARYPSYTPDGASILYSSDQDDGYQVWSIDRASGATKELTSADETGYETPLTPYFRGAGNAVYPILSPDGSHIVMVIDGERDALVIRDTAGKDAPKVLFAANTLGAPVWAPSGDTLYVAGIIGDNGLLVSVPVDGSPVTRLVDGPDVFPFRPSITPAGDVMYTADGGVHTISVDGATTTSIPFAAHVALDRTPYKRRIYDLTSEAPQPALGVIDPILSPDGTKAAFAALGDIWIADLATGETTQLTDDAFVDLSPSWSPDGSKLAFSTDRGGKTDIWLMDLASGVLTQLTDDPKPANSAIWSPDGTRIAYLADALTTVFLGSTVNVIDVATGEETVLSDPIFGPSAPAWSADGKSIIVVARRPVTNRFREGYNAFYMMPSSGEGEKSWILPVGEVKSLGRRQWNRPAWSSDGTVVYRVDGALYMMPMTSEGVFGQAVEIAKAGENPTWSADASKLIYIDGKDIMLYDRASGETRTLDIKPKWVRDMPDESLTIRAGHMFDGLGDAYVENVDIVVEKGVITAVHPAGEGPVEGTLIDASDKYVIPGLIESHTHQSTSQGVPLGDIWFSHGITTVRETGDDPYHAVERREASDAGKRPAPRVFTAGPLNEGARVSYGVSETVGTVERAEDSMRLSTELKLNMYKSYVRQNYTVQNRTIELAHESGIPVSSHELYPAVANGIDQMEHFGATSRRGYSLKISALSNTYQDVIALISESGLVVTPTLALMTRYGTTNTDKMEATLKRIVDNGGRIVAGTDSPFIPYGASLHKELEIYAEAGLTPAKVIRTATSEAAVAIGVGDFIGSIEPGHLADIAILDADPLANISNVSTVDTVIKNGEVVWSED
tara:strand:+ start:4259 stop:7222 length:2964 start_codon:yes stop_codon:yes gene_type:complete